MIGSGTGLRAVALVVVTDLVLAGCSSEGAGERLPGPGQGVGINDVNPQPREAVRDGGDLRWPLDALPDNFNYNQFEGLFGPTLDVISALLPGPFRRAADGELRINPDYLSAAELTSTSPQTITYTINPNATWSDGTSITWRDFEAQWRALNGTNQAYLVAGKSGHEAIASVTRGIDDRQVVVTFARAYAEWKSLFSPLYPASTNSDPTVFNTGWANEILTTAGPFVPERIDRTAKTVTLRRNDRWWGDRPKLDRIIFKVYERTALADGLANNELDFYPIGSSVDLLKRARSIPGVTIRQSPVGTYNHITFNGAPGAILSDLKLRQAVAKGIDRTAIARRLVGQIVPSGGQVGNHIYAVGSKDYRDNSDVLAFDQPAANRELDALGWVRQGAVRAKDGQQLRLRLMEAAPNPVVEQIDRTVLDQLAQIGVTVEIEPVPIASATTQYKKGNFDLVCFAWRNTGTPLSSTRGIYAEPRGDDVAQNYGRIYNPEITALFDQALRELDDTRRAEIGNRIDRLIWQEVHHLPLYPSPGANAVRSTLANFGAPGFADIDHVNAGFLR